MRIEFSPERSLYPFESRWFDSSAGRVHYVDEGTGAPLLLLHGNPTWSFLYRHIIGAMRDRYRCVAPDYLGFGLSERPDGFGYTIEEHARVVGEPVDHLGLDDVVVMGQDWGRPIGCAVAVERADRIRGLVLGNTWFWPADRPRITLFSRIMSTGLMLRQILVTSRSAPAASSPGCSPPSPTTSWSSCPGPATTSRKTPPTRSPRRSPRASPALHPTGDRSTMREPVIQGLVGVYHANGSLRGELAYVLGKLIGRSHCVLCDITHARLRRRPSFDTSVATLPVAFELVHLDERSGEVAAASQGRTPCVLARTDRGMTLLLGADALESCDGGPAELRAAIDRAVTALGLRWP